MINLSRFLFKCSRLTFKLQSLYYFCRTITIKPSASASTKADYDLVVIGGGSGGLSCAKEAASLGARVAVLDYVEPSPKGTKWGLGGTCVNVGCIPKKLMHHAASVGKVLTYARKYGWQVPDQFAHSWEELVINITNHIKSLNFKHKAKLMEKKVKYINAKGYISNPNTVIATTIKSSGFTETVLTTNYICIAVGKRPKLLSNLPGIEYCITSDDIFWRKAAPGKTLCVGASYVGLEIAGFLTGLGYDVTVMARSMPLTRFDQQMAKLVVEAMQRNGTRFFIQTLPVKIEKEKRLRVYYKSADGTVSNDVFDTVIIAIGRYSMTSNIGLEQIGVQMDSDGCIVGNYGRDFERSSVPNIYAIGDILQNGLELTPVAIRAGKLLAHRLFGNSQKQMDYCEIPTTVYTPIEYGFIGMSEEYAIFTFGEDGIDVYHSFFVPLEYTVAENFSDSKSCYIKVIVKRSAAEEVLGIHYTGPHAGEIVQGFAVAFRCNLTFSKLVSSVGIHPTVAEEFVKLSITKRSGLDPNVSGC